VPKGHELDSIYQELLDTQKILAEEVAKTDLHNFRVLLKKIVNADNGVFTKGMESYTAGYRGFVTRDRIGQEGGEFMGEWLENLGSHLTNVIVEDLDKKDDVITSLCLPLLHTDGSHYEPDVGESSIFSTNDSMRDFGERFALSADTLASHLEAHPNKLFRLRHTVLFISFMLVRYLSSLESIYDEREQIEEPPLLLDFSPSGPTSLSRASLQTYTRASQSLVRFYSREFTRRLQEDFGDISVLLSEPVPLYEGQKRKRRTKRAVRHEQEAKAIWNLAIKRSQLAQNDSFLPFGEALYDMLSTQAEASPIDYLRKLGLRIGLLYPPNQSTHRFMVKQDLLETLLRSIVDPNESIDMSKLQLRLWQRFRILIGGLSEDESRLLEAGIYEVDNDGLRKNEQNFALALRQLDFAEMLADGVLQVEVPNNV
jgi:hypothetical protein